MKNYKINDEGFVFICSVHDLIEEKAEEIKDALEVIFKAEKVAKEMGQNMERAIIDRNSKISELELKIDTLKEKLKKEKAKHARKPRLPKV